MEDRDMSIAGSGKINGGEYRKISISGSCKLSNDIVCEELRIAGSAHATGSLECSGDARVSGSFHCDGALSAQGELRIAGSCRVDGAVEGNILRIAGSFHSGGKIVGKEVKISGYAWPPSGLEAEQVVISGRAEVGGLLSAENIEIDLAKNAADSNIAQIGGTNIRVRESAEEGVGGFFSRLFSGKSHGTLVASLVEGDNIELSHTKCETVRGKRVVIGDSCVIGRVEYTDFCEISEKAKVNGVEKV